MVVISQRRMAKEGKENMTEQSDKGLYLLYHGRLNAKHGLIQIKKMPNSYCHLCAPGKKKIQLRP